jgi:hypothetical protein
VNSRNSVSLPLNLLAGTIKIAEGVAPTSRTSQRAIPARPERKDAMFKTTVTAAAFAAVVALTGPAQAQLYAAPQPYQGYPEVSPAWPSTPSGAPFPPPSEYYRVNPSWPGRDQTGYGEAWREFQSANPGIGPDGTLQTPEMFRLR